MELEDSDLVSQIVQHFGEGRPANDTVAVVFLKHGQIASQAVAAVVQKLRVDVFHIHQSGKIGLSLNKWTVS